MSIKDLIAQEAEAAETAEVDSQIDETELPADTKVTRGHRPDANAADPLER